MNHPKPPRGVLLSILALALWCGAVFLSQQVAGLARGVQVRWPEGEGVSPAQLERLERYAAEDGAEDVPSVTLWREDAAQTFSDGGDKAASGSLVTLFGGGEDAYPAAFYAGGYPVRGDGEGCAVDRGVAESLWGSGDVLGTPVHLGQKIYYVRGVLEGTAGVMLIQGAAGSAQTMPNLMLRFSSGSDRTQAEAWLAQSNLSGGTLLDLPLLSFLLSIFTALPGGVLLMGILLRLVRRGVSLGTSPVLLLGYLLPAILGAALALWAMGPLPAVPVQLIPGQWSDFAFWPELFGDLANTLKAWFSAGLGRRDFLLWPAILGGLVLTLLAAGLTALAAERARAHTEGGVVLGCLAAVGTLFVCVLWAADRGGLTLTRTMWLLPPLWLWAGWCLDRHRDYLTPKREEDAHEAEQKALNRV